MYSLTLKPDSSNNLINTIHKRNEGGALNKNCAQGRQMIQYINWHTVPALLSEFKVLR